jgi:NAD(P)-dependent dehydrogenase (short-subunit alcohol dehydrogenase family)
MVLAQEGASVVVNDLGGTLDGQGQDAKVADMVVQEIKDAGGNAAANYSDISELDGVDALMWTATNKFGKLDVMINNAGILRDKTLLNMSESDWDIVMKVHAKGTFLCTRAAARIMKVQKTGGAIVNTTSISGLAGNFGQANYGGAKMAIYALTKISAMEFSRAGIRVNCVGPSGFTRMVASIGRGEAGQPDEKTIEETNSVMPTAILAAYLASDLAKNITGRVMSSHGGTKINKISEYKVLNSEGLQKDDGMFTIQEIADNIDKMLFPEPDINMVSGRPAPRK